MLANVKGVQMLDKIQNDLMTIVMQEQDQLDLAQEKKQKELANFKKDENVIRMKQIMGVQPPAIQQYGLQ